MDFDIAYFKIKIIADMLWYIIWWISWYLFYQNIFSKYPQLKNPFNKTQNFDYILTIIAGAFGCGIFFSTLDNFLLHPEKDILVTKSIAASLFWATIFSEIFKKIHNVKFNTGVLWVPGLVLGLIVWRIGAFMIGLRDNTHGIVTNLPWGIDYGDGFLRHPLQLYEVGVLILFFAFFCFSLQYKREYILRNGFFLFTLTYFSYRFFIGFISPYSDFWYGLNTYQVISIIMIWYSFYKLKKYS